MATPETTSPVSKREEFDLTGENTWKQLYSLLESLARYFVYS